MCIKVQTTNPWSSWDQQEQLQKLSRKDNNHQTSDMSRGMISPESRSKLEMVILSSLRFLTI